MIDTCEMSITTAPIMAPSMRPLEMSLLLLSGEDAVLDDLDDEPAVKVTDALLFVPEPVLMVADERPKLFWLTWIVGGGGKGRAM